jgi:hypothetical protein
MRTRSPAAIAVSEYALPDIGAENRFLETHLAAAIRGDGGDQDADFAGHRCGRSADRGHRSWPEVAKPDPHQRWPRGPPRAGAGSVAQAVAPGPARPAGSTRPGPLRSRTRPRKTRRMASSAIVRSSPSTSQCHHSGANIPTTESSATSQENDRMRILCEVSCCCTGCRIADPRGPEGCPNGFAGVLPVLVRSTCRRAAKGGSWR